MKVTIKFLHIPPYISTSWNNVKSLHIDNSTLVVSLVDGSPVHISHLPETDVKLIFETHRLFLEQQETVELDAFRTDIFSAQGQRQEIPFKLGIASLEELTALPQHNAAQANIPNLPPEILEKIVAITKIVAPEGAAFTKAEPHCNCLNCQVSRALDNQEPRMEQRELPKAVEEEISEKDLSFQQWEITQQNPQIYLVSNKLDANEHYTVYLGEPVGCTCGKSGCDHVIAVLKS